jgi:predicted glutamine amidotransferase
MCRWLAYMGPTISLDTLVMKPEHSLVAQSLNAQRNITAVNGDGFGIGWYGEDSCPGVFRDTAPAWHDENLRHLAAQIRSPLFLAHVRASSGSEVQRTNCHPFQYENWLFQHNGEIGGFDRVKRVLDQAIDPDLYPALRGSTDSERMFFLALSFGLREDPPSALQQMVGFVEKARSDAAIKEPAKMTIAVSDGERIFALRYSSYRDSQTLYHSRNIHALREVGGECEEMSPDAVIVLSEPLDDISEHWEEIPESALLVVEPGKIEAIPFEPAV